MKNLFIIVLSFTLGLSTYAQETSKDVTITASASGATMEEAQRFALRSATEQAFGAFISSKTEIFNDQIVADEISSVSSGNIKSFDILNQAQLPDGRWGCTLKALVSVDKLTSFVQAKGVEVEIKGGLFALNIKQQMLNEEGEIKAMCELIGLLHEPMQTSFDYTLASGNPISLDAQNSNWEIPVEVTAICNSNMDFCDKYFMKTLKALSLSTNELESYKSLNKQIFPVSVVGTVYYLRKQASIEIINSFASNWQFYVSLFSVYSNSQELIGKFESNIIPFGQSNEDKTQMTINFPSLGSKAAVFGLRDKRTLSQIEQMEGYSVKPKGILSKFK